MLIEMTERAKRVDEITGRLVEDRRAMSVIAGLLDPETAKHTAQYQGAKASVEVLKRKVMEFINLVTANDTNKMDLDRVQHNEFSDASGAWDGDAWESENANEELNAFGDKCHNCGGVGHYSRECPSKSKGKGKSGGEKGFKGDGKGGKGKGAKGDGKGSKGKGKASAPMYGGCWTCGGAHFSKDCPKAPGKGVAKGGSEVRLLSCLKVVERTAVTTRNRFQALSDSSDEQEERSGKGRSQRKIKDETSDRGGQPGVVSNTRQRGSREREAPKLGSFIEIVPEQIKSVDQEEEWQEIELAVDSGATETVVGTTMLTNIATTEGVAFKRGVQYEVASGELIDNLGEKSFVGYSEGGDARGLTAQVCDVNKALLSVKRMVAAGNRVVFEPAGGYIEDLGTGRTMELKEQGGMYMLKLWVQKPFQRQASRKP